MAIVMHKDPDTLYKLGVTHFRDADRRFSSETAKRYGFVNTELTTDYRITRKMSRWLPRLEAHILEIRFKKMFPKNVWTTENYNGITECRCLSPKKGINLYNSFDRSYPKSEYGGQNEGKTGYVKVYLYTFEKKVKYED